MRSANYFNHGRKLASTWWEGTTGLPPVDNIIKKVQTNAYAHHIERLMYLAAPMLMIGIDPTEVYNWFISFVSIDAYDWVMVPNIYGMGTYADGGLMMSRPYFSSGNYIKKMSNFNDDETTDKWTALYYNFIVEQKAKLRKNYYTARWIPNWDKKSADEKKKIRNVARAVIKKNTK